MNKLWICLGCVALVSVVGRAEGELKYDYYSDEVDYPNSKADENVENKELEYSDDDNIEFQDNADDSGEIIYDDEFDRAKNILNIVTSKDRNEDINKENNKQDDIDDYQIEDNRSEDKENKPDFGKLVESIDDFDIQSKINNNMDEDFQEFIHKEATKMKDDQISDDAKELPVDPENYDEELLEQEASEDVADNIADDTGFWESPAMDEEIKAILRKDDDKFINYFSSLDQSQESNVKKGIDDVDETEVNDDKLSLDEQLDSDDNQQSNAAQQIFNETKRILEESNGPFDKEMDVDGKLTSSSASIEDTETNNSNEENADRSSENKTNTSTDKYNIDDDTIAEAYGDLKDDLNTLRETWMKLKDDVTGVDINKENLPGLDEVDTRLADIAQQAEEDEDDYEVIDDKDLFKLFKEISDLDDDESDEIEENEEDEIEPTLPIAKESNSDFLAKSEQSKSIQYFDDALIANEDDRSRGDVETSTHDVTTMTKIMKEPPLEPSEEAQVSELEIFNDAESEKVFTEPIRISLSLDTAVVLTSPNFPNPYPPNAVIDWILEGEGRGIEFNVTDFALNSIAGDFVMVKPGRADDSGSDGILLSYSLNTPRAFRFLNVNRVFIRFESKQGLNRFRGFSFSIKLIDPIPEDRILEPEVRPIGYPHSTITLNLGGITLEDFLQVKEDFRQIVADMATMYIEANRIEPGLNTTLEVTQITSTALCFHNWPQFEQCAEVRFGVSLEYDDDEMEPRLNEQDLRDMWTTLADRNPFALRLQRLGIREFQIPNDSKILMIWLVIAAGVVISMAMLAFALWRFSCFEDYARMPAFSDTESVNEKKTLDLYPTPHQTLPPLYSDTEYKWGEAKYDDTARVDMSGFPNRGYARSEECDFDSDDEAATPARDRYTTDV